MLKICGIEHKTGEFQNRPYDNYVFYAYDDVQQNGKWGICTVAVKTKSSLVHTMYTPDKVKDLIGHYVTFYYDQYRNVSQILIDHGINK